MLIAMMNNSFEKIMENADVEWKFSRTQMWLEWIDKGNTIPVPFNIVYYILNCICSNCCRTCCCKERKNDQEQGNAQAQVKNHGEQNWITRLFSCCCSCICTCGICRYTMGCTCCTEEKRSMREERMKEMNTLVVEYLKDRYKEKWQELYTS
ncbi:Short transient receptor putative channel 4 [Desmophyllum pertusum]|uniref:Short transient receptor putative channel 4 n=1 Tax=Desmophyllum pertusum TaxID=174260 RepID=A0A9W9Z9V3_9CNID|nr:Short transient receptor putative channel 4 [Desmophyllum pertusum]